MDEPLKVKKGITTTPSTEKRFLSIRPSDPPNCVICGKETDGACADQWVCLDCFVSKKYHEWLEKKAA